MLFTALNGNVPNSSAPTYKLLLLTVSWLRESTPATFAGCRGYTVRKQLLDQAWIRRVSVLFAVHVNSHRSHIGDVDHITARQLALNIQVPVVGCTVREMSIEDDRSTIGGAIGNAGRCRLRGNDSGNMSEPRGVVEGLNREVGIGGLKRRIGAGIFDLVAEYAVVENAESCPNRGLAISQGSQEKPMRGSISL